MTATEIPTVAAIPTGAGAAARDPDDFLPLRPVVFAIFLVLRAAPLHGYGIMQRVNQRLGRNALLGPGTLYRTLKELRDEGLIRRAEAPDDEEEPDARRHYYGLTDLGESVVGAEARRVAALLRDGAFDDLVSEAGGGG